MGPSASRRREAGDGAHERSRRRCRARAWTGGALTSALAACGAPSPAGFDDHTVPEFEDGASFLAHASERVGAQVVKFHLIPFADPASRHLSYLDGNFYELHDEWYWFRLLNGQEVEDDHSFEPYAGDFATVDEIYAWARTEPAPLPLDLVWSGDRLYSPRFYELSADHGDTPKLIAPGVLMNFPERSSPAPRASLWLFELPFAEEPSYEEIEVYFASLEATLPSELAHELRWVTRSASQEALARTMATEALPGHDRTLRYDALSAPVSATVYTPGITAGRVRIFADEASVVPVGVDTILVLGEARDDLPPVRALITAFPQEPSDPLRVAAEQAGVVDVTLPGALVDANLDQFARVWAHAIVRATAQDEWTVAPISATDFATWKSLGSPDDFLLALLAAREGE